MTHTKEPLQINREEILHEFTIDPVSAPRMTKSDAWKKRPAVTKYHAFKDHFRMLANVSKWELPEYLRVIFVMPMPPSWSDKKKRTHSGTPHQQRPDFDNLVKALMDTMKKEDSYVWAGDVKKIWGYTGKIIILK